MPDGNETLAKVIAERDEIYDTLLKTRNEFEAMKHAYNKVHSEYIRKNAETEHWRTQYHLAVEAGIKILKEFHDQFNRTLNCIQSSISHELKEKYPRIPISDFEALIQKCIPNQIR